VKYKEDIFIAQFSIAKMFVYHLIYYRELHKAYGKSGLKSEFWVHTIDAHLLQAAIQWCMIFGSDGYQPTHWKKLTDGETTELEESFRKGLFEKTTLTQKSWKTFWLSMNDFRNQYAAHREVEFIKPIPDFSIALEVIFFYDGWLREVISPDFMEEPLLKNSREELVIKFKPFAAYFVEETAKRFNGI
jgi:hypothetical protein